MNAGLTIRVRREPGCAIVIVAGEIDIATVARLRQRLNTLADSGRHVIADLDQVGFMDASGLGAIVGASRRATAHGSSFQVVCDRRQTRQLFRLARARPPDPVGANPGRGSPGSGERPASTRMIRQWAYGDGIWDQRWLPAVPATAGRTLAHPDDKADQPDHEDDQRDPPTGCGWRIRGRRV